MTINSEYGGFSEKQIIIKATSDLNSRQKELLHAVAPFNLDRVTMLDLEDSGILNDPIDYSLNTPHLNISEVEERKSSDKILAIAPVMPVNLITPLGDADSIGSNVEALEEVDMSLLNKNSVSWGVESVGAARSNLDGTGVVIAILDTGIDKRHEVFAGIDFVCKNFTTDDDGNEDNVTDYIGHGTHCAGTIFGRSNDKYGRIGIATGVTRVLVAKVIGRNGGDSEQVVNAIQWAAEEGADIISMSLGIDYPGKVAQLEETLPTKIAVSRALEGYRATVIMFDRLASLMMSRNIIIIGAAGNESRRNQNPQYVVGVSPPSVAEGIVSVAALGLPDVNRKYDLAPFSNIGANIAAPGVGVISAKVNGGLRRLSGTSMAAPHVAGVAALWLQKLNQQNGGNTGYKTISGYLIGRADSTVFVNNFNLRDIGSGLVQAPLP